MPPKFQSSFIPKGPIATSSSGAIPQISRVRHIDFVSFISKIVFGISILLAVGAVGYKWYLNYSIKKMGVELEQARQEIAGGVVGELVDLNNRIATTESLIKGHEVLSPLFGFLGASTPKTVRFDEFNYTMGDKGPQIFIRGQASSYAALALESKAINQNPDLNNPVFSDIHLDERGNVAFSLKADVTPNLLSYQKAIGRLSAPAPTQGVLQTSTSTATTTVRTATTTASTTPRTSTSTPPR